MKTLFKLFGKLIKTAIISMIIVIIIVVAFVLLTDKKDKNEIKHNEPIVEKQDVVIETEDEIEDITEEIIVEEEPEIEVQEERPKEEVVDDNTIRPEFKKSMESYEEFFDEYIEFMQEFKKDSTSISMLTKYADFLTKYEKAISEMDKIDESTLTKAEDKLFLETQLRINNKLTQAAINY